MACVVCKSDEAVVISSTNNSANPTFKCPRCGVFSITQSAIAELKNNPRSTDRWKLSSWIKDNSDKDFISTHDLETAIHAKVPTIRNRAERILNYLNKSQSFGSEFYFSNLLTNEELVSISWSINSGEVRYLIEQVLVKSYNYLTFTPSGITCVISAEGYEFLENSKINIESTIGFTAMWFDSSMNIVWTDVIKPAIEGAGYSPLRVDQVEHAGKIDDEIVASIRRSRFVVADFTGHRGGVYFEAGLAQGLGLPVIWCCREDELSQLHFDIRQYNCLQWRLDDLPDFKRRLTNRIQAVIGRGPIN